MSHSYFLGERAIQPTENRVCVGIGTKTGISVLTNKVRLHFRLSSSFPETRSFVFVFHVDYFLITYHLFVIRERYIGYRPNLRFKRPGEGANHIRRCLRKKICFFSTFNVIVRYFSTTQKIVKPLKYLKIWRPRCNVPTALR